MGEGHSKKQQQQDAKPLAESQDQSPQHSNTQTSQEPNTPNHQKQAEIPAEPAPLSLDDFKNAHPMKVLQSWVADAFKYGEEMPFVMHLATVGSEGRPRVRVVAFGGADDSGIYFVSVEGSQKVKDLGSNPGAAASIYWRKTQRCVRIEGVARACPEKSGSFERWPRPMQIKMHASRSQSDPVEDWDADQRRAAEEFERFADVEEIPKPDFMSAFLIVPDAVQFMQDRRTALPDRILFSRKIEEDSWDVQRLHP